MKAVTRIEIHLGKRNQSAPHPTLSPGKGQPSDENGKLWRASLISAPTLQHAFEKPHSLQRQPQFTVL